MNGRSAPTLDLAPLVEHGGAQPGELRALGLAPRDVIDFSASVNPYGPSSAVKRALRTVPLDRYPDPYALLLVEALSRFLDVGSEWIVPGNGASELLRMAAHAWAGPDRLVASLSPSFGEYSAAAASVAAPWATFDTSPDDGFRTDVNRLSRFIHEHRPALLYLCNPNNPTGDYLGQDDVERIVAAAAPGTVVLDEAYVSFVSNASPSIGLLERWPNLVIVRSMTKDHALTALRLGYALAHPDRAASFRRALPSWNVNGLAQAAGVAALSDVEYMTASVRRVNRAKQQLLRGLQALGLEPIGGAANFVLVDVQDAAAVRGELLRQGLMVRDCTSFGLPGHVRIAVRRPSEQRRLLGALGEVWEARTARGLIGKSVQ